MKKVPTSCANPMRQVVRIRDGTALYVPPLALKPFANKAQKYLPEDLKGKGEPSFSIERALKEGERIDHGRNVSEGNNSYEMQPSTRERSASGSHAMGPNRPSSSALKYADFEGEMRRSHSTGRRVGEGLKRRFGSLRRTKKTT